MCGTITHTSNSVECSSKGAGRYLAMEPFVDGTCVFGSCTQSLGMPKGLNKRSSLVFQNLDKDSTGLTRPDSVPLQHMQLRNLLSYWFCCSSRRMLRSWCLMTVDGSAMTQEPVTSTGSSYMGEVVVNANTTATF